MANEIQVVAEAGLTLYFHVRQTDGDVWYPVGVVFENYGTSGDSDDYDIALVDHEVGLYVGTFPAAITTAGEYIIVVLEQLGANPADADLILGSQSFAWGGTGTPSVLTNFIATQFLAGNLSQNKDTGTITIFDTDGTTTLATFTYNDSESDLARAIT